MQTIDRVLTFWIDDLGPAGWYAGTAEIDDRVRQGFEDLWHDAMTGGLGPWLAAPRGALAYLIVTDQIPRNMFRDTAGAFASDAIARAAAKFAIQRGWDKAIPEPDRQFFYMPLMHSENLIDQDRCVAHFRDDMPESGADNLVHARAHREVIRRFGRFPTRNPALSRDTTPGEAVWLAGGGYVAEVKRLRENPAD